MNIYTVMTEALGVSHGKAMSYSRYAEQACIDWDINNPKRIASFLTHTYYETQKFTRFKENGNYRPDRLLKIFPKYFDSYEQAKQYCSRSVEIHGSKDPAVKIFSRVYANRFGNGDEASHDGYDYCGKSPIHLTFKDNYEECEAATGINIVENPSNAAKVQYGFSIAAWYFSSRGLNENADLGNDKFILDNFVTETATRKIQGGNRGLAERRKAKKKILALYHREIEGGGTPRDWFKSIRNGGAVLTTVGGGITAADDAGIIDVIPEPTVLDSMGNAISGISTATSTMTDITYASNGNKYVLYALVFAAGALFIASYIKSRREGKA